MSLKITSYCRINNDSIFLNGELFFKNENPEESLTRTAYKFLELSYPKFYKMDILSKYGFLASEVLISNHKNLSKYGEDEVILIFANSESSNATDLKYQETIVLEKPSPSPSLFVYTLPNILLGEIAIRNKWYGESIFFVFQEFDADFLAKYTTQMLTNVDAKACIVAWVNPKETKNDVFLCIIEKNEHNNIEALALSPNNLYKIYQE